MPRVGGYWVHAAKIRRLGIPILLRHTIVEAFGDKVIEGAVIQELDDRFSLIGKPRTIECDVICMAVGLTPTTELFWQAEAEMLYCPQLCGHVPFRDDSMRTSHPDIWVAGDAAGIEEASSAMVEGRVAGLNAARSLARLMDHEFDARSSLYWKRLSDLRAGPVGEKIRYGISQACCGSWEV